jgi:hypothetical protein
MVGEGERGGMRKNENQDRKAEYCLGLRNGFAAAFSGGKEKGKQLSWNSCPDSHA